MINISMPESESASKPRIVVFGVGGGGGNAVANMIRSGITDIEFVVANTDEQVLATNIAAKKLQLGRTVTKGLGAGARPDVGRAAAEEQLDEINAYLEGAHMCFITAGMGGGTGTGAAPVIARIAREKGILTVGVVTKPFQFEGPVRQRSAEAGIQDLQQYVDTLIIIPNQNLFRIANEKTTWTEAFKLADNVLYQGVRGVTDLIMTPGQINLDFADIRSVMSEMGKAMMGTGEAEGDNRALQAAEMAINNPLLDDASVKGARGVLINITGGNDLTLFEVEEAANRIRDEVDPDANIIFGTALDESMEGRIRISVVATGIDLEMQRERPPLSVVGGNAVATQSAYLPSGTPSTAQTAARTVSAPPLFAQGMTAPAPAVKPQQAVASAAVATTAGQPNFYSGMQAEQVGNTLRVQQVQQQFDPVVTAARHAEQRAEAQAAIRGTRQGEQFIAPQPAAPASYNTRATAEPTYAQPQQPAAQAPRRSGFGRRMVEGLKNFVRQIDGEGAVDQPQAAHFNASGPQGQAYAVQPQQQPLPQQAQPASRYEVTQGGKAGLPPVEDIELDIPSFLRRQAN